MHAMLKRRIGRLEERSDAGSSEPRKVHRIVVTCLDREPGLENAECSRDALSKRHALGGRADTGVSGAQGLRARRYSPRRRPRPGKTFSWIRLFFTTHTPFTMTYGMPSEY